MCDFVDCVYGGNFRDILSYLGDGRDVNGVVAGLAPLHFAAKSGRANVVRLLVARGGDVSKRAIYGTAPLHFATNRAVAEVLIGAGSDVNWVTERGYTLLHIVADRKRCTKMAEFLLDCGANVNAVDSKDAITYSSTI